AASPVGSADPAHRHLIVLEPLVVERTHERGIVDARDATIGPPGDGVVDLADARRRTTAVDDTLTVPSYDGTAQVSREGTGGPSDVDHLGVGPEDDSRDLAVRREPSQHRLGHGAAAVLPLGRRCGHECRKVYRSIDATRANSSARSAGPAGPAGPAGRSRSDRAAGATGAHGSAGAAGGSGASGASGANVPPKAAGRPAVR